MKPFHTALISFTLFLSACAADPFTVMHDHLKPTEGQHIDKAIALIGYPDEEKTIAGKKIYFWRNGGAVALPSTTTSNTRGVIGSTSYSGTTTSLGTSIASISCEIKIVTENDIILKVEAYGDNYGCRKYSQSIENKLGLDGK
ncbi:MAG: hypothetical protein R3D66_04680 [Alphaproteobacteria bacterium]